MSDLQQLQILHAASIRAMPGPWERSNLVRLITAGLSSLANRGDIESKAVVDLLAAGQVDLDATFISAARGSMDSLNRILEQHQRMAKALHFYVESDLKALEALEADCGQVAKISIQDVEVLQDPEPPPVAVPKEKLS